jgi:hypothetical protein
VYASLERLDVGFSPPGGGAIYLQTDHRDALTITGQASLSVIFAITRCLVAYRAAVERGQTPFQVVYALEGDAPPFLSYVVEAAGGTIVKQPPTEVRASSAPQIAALEKLVADAVTQLAAETWRREDLEPSLAGLVAYEFGARFAVAREDEVAYATRIVTLGALAASVLLPSLEDARWVFSPGSIVPFVLAGRRGDRKFAAIDVFGKAQRFASDGLDESPSALVAAVTGDVIDFGDPFAAYTRLRGETITPDVLEARALAGSADDREMSATAEALAREAADAFRQWGLAIGDEVHWETRPAIEIDMRPVGKALLELAGGTYDDGHVGVFDRAMPLGEAAERAIARHRFLDARREDWLHEATWRSAVVLNRRVPANAPRFAGRRFHEVPNPFAPLLAIWATGYLAPSLDERGITLVVVTAPPAGSSS